jgi:hypothetical protein
VLVDSLSRPSLLLLRTNSIANRAPVAGASKAADTPAHSDTTNQVRGCRGETGGGSLDAAAVYD